MSVSDPLEKLRRCQLGCFEYGQCKANMHGAPSECPALTASAPVPQDYYETPGATDPNEAQGWSARKRAPAPPTASPDGMDLSAKELHYWPYCGKCHEPFDFDKDAPFASCKCGTGEWGNPRPAAWVHDPRAPLTDEQIDRAADEWSYAILLGKGSVAAREAFRAALSKGRSEGMSNREAAAASERPLPPLPKSKALRRQARRDGGYDMVPAYTVEEVIAIVLADRAASAPQAVRMPLTDEEIDAAARRTMTGSNASGLALSAFKAGARWAERHTPKEGKNP